MNFACHILILFLVSLYECLLCFTGGFAGIIAPECETINRVDEALTLKGMRIIWEDAR